MANASDEDLGEWVAKQTALLEPPAAWYPDRGEALMSILARSETNGSRVWRRWAAWAAAAALAVPLFVWMPAGRAVAYQVWQLLTVRRVAFIRVKPWPEGVRSPQVGLIGTPVPPIPARDLEEARWRVHYDPRLPRADVLSRSPQLYTTFSLSAGTVVKVDELESALRKAGVTDLHVPPQWDGAQLALHTSAVVIAQWPDIVLAQSLPLTLTAPSVFDFWTYSMLVLRVLGVGQDEAQRLAQRMGTTPPWLAPIAHDVMRGATIEEVTLNSGPATLLQETGDDGTVKRVSVLWSVPDRVYLLTGSMHRELAIAVANAVE
jgi:hypothetical protein